MASIILLNVLSNLNKIIRHQNYVDLDVCNAKDFLSYINAIRPQALEAKEYYSAYLRRKPLINTPELLASVAYGASYTDKSTVTDVANNMINDVKRSKKTARIISGPTAAINSDEYRIVTKVGYHYISIDGGII